MSAEKREFQLTSCGELWWNDASARSSGSHICQCQCSSGLLMQPDETIRISVGLFAKRCRTCVCVRHIFINIALLLGKRGRF